MVRRGDDTDRTRYCAAAVDCAGNGASAVPERAPGTLAATPLPRRALPAPRPQFQHVFGEQLTPPPAGDAFDDALITFDQDGYAGAVWPALASYGFAYVPSACAEGAPCRLHVALHGCGQSAWRETAAAQDSTSRELGAGWARPPVGARARSSCAHLVCTPWQRDAAHPSSAGPTPRPQARYYPASARGTRGTPASTSGRG